MKRTTFNLKTLLVAAGIALLAVSSPAIAGTTTIAAESKGVTEVVPEPEKPWTLTLSDGWDSEYMFRGVDLLDNEGLHWTDVNIAAYGFKVGAWFAFGVDDPDEYSELDAYASYSHSFGPVTLEAGYIYYLFFHTTGFAHDTHEVYVGASYAPTDWLTASLYYYYDFDVFNAHYLEFKVASSIPLYKDVLKLNPYALIAAGNYNTGSQFEWDHAQAGVELAYSITKSITVSGYGAYARALEGTHDLGATQDDEFWGGAKVSISF